MIALAALVILPKWGMARSPLMASLDIIKLLPLLFLTGIRN